MFKTDIFCLPELNEFFTGLLDIAREKLDEKEGLGYDSEVMQFETVLIMHARNLVFKELFQGDRTRSVEEVLETIHENTPQMLEEVKNMMVDHKPFDFNLWQEPDVESESLQDIFELSIDEKTEFVQMQLTIQDVMQSLWEKVPQKDFMRAMSVLSTGDSTEIISIYEDVIIGEQREEFKRIIYPQTEKSFFKTMGEQFSLMQELKNNVTK